MPSAMILLLNSKSRSPASTLSAGGVCRALSTRSQYKASMSSLVGSILRPPSAALSAAVAAAVVRAAVGPLRAGFHVLRDEHPDGFLPRWNAAKTVPRRAIRVRFSLDARLLAFADVEVHLQIIRSSRLGCGGRVAAQSDRLLAGPRLLPPPNTVTPAGLRSGLALLLLVKARERLALCRRGSLKRTLPPAAGAPAARSPHLPPARANPDARNPRRGGGAVGDGGVVARQAPRPPAPRSALRAARLSQTARRRSLATPSRFPAPAQPVRAPAPRWGGPSPPGTLNNRQRWPSRCRRRWRQSQVAGNRIPISRLSYRPAARRRRRHRLRHDGRRGGRRRLLRHGLLFGGRQPKTRH